VKTLIKQRLCTRSLAEKWPQHSKKMRGNQAFYRLMTAKAA
jgi:hypothetical protein